MSDAASETMVEYALADMIYHVENEDNLPEFWCFKSDTFRTKRMWETVYPPSWNIPLIRLKNKLSLKMDYTLIYHHHYTRLDQCWNIHVLVWTDYCSSFNLPKFWWFNFDTITMKADAVETNYSLSWNIPVIRLKKELCLVMDYT